MDNLIPIEDAWVCLRQRPTQIGRVISTSGSNGSSAIEVDFGPQGKSRLSPGEWGCGLQPGFIVQDVPLSGTRRTLGLGTVLSTRELATREQALVQLHSDGHLIWLPFERLRRLRDPALSFRRAQIDHDNSSERLSLNVLGHALKHWNELTGALGRLDIDPLPHQLALVHRIITSGQTNWLIADDVGLGKTIEVGLLITALERRQALRRILLVVPAGLTRQWQDDMFLKFDRDFLIYGRDFRPSLQRHWGMYERVIISLDAAKPQDSEDDGSSLDTTFGMLLAAGNWDLIVFDEAHRLSRTDRGDSTLRYKLAQQIRPKTDKLILLTGTPHQGDTGRFRNLLRLVRPDLHKQIDDIEFVPDVVREIVLRNRKIDVVDIEGKFLFSGLLVRRIEVEDPDFASLEQRLLQYLQQGYRASDELGGAAGRAIGFVMTIYRKLASSSVAALYAALHRRLNRIASQSMEHEEQQVEPESDAEAEENEVNFCSPSAFFEGEAELLQSLVDYCVPCIRTNAKGSTLVGTVKSLVFGESKKVLIFTEYRATQVYLQSVLRSALGIEAAVIKGGMTVDQKTESITKFENDTEVLISTEAGGEGLNLHRNCHVLINFDLPWNPSRLSQRIGRLYRYGQKEKVIVLNFHARDSIDNDILSNLVDRVNTIAIEMASVSHEFRDRDAYASDVMGELLDRVDISGLLEEARVGTIERTTERIDAAVKEAARARELQNDMLQGTGDLNMAELVQQSFSTAQLATILQRICPFLNIEIIENFGESFTIRLPDILIRRFAEFGARTNVRITTARRNFPSKKDEVLLDLSSDFVTYLLKHVTSPEFDGGYGVFIDDDMPTLAAFYVGRLQNDQGRIQAERLIVVQQDEQGRMLINESLPRRMLEQVLRPGYPDKSTLSMRRDLLDSARDRAEVTLAQEINRFLHPNDLVLIGIGERGTAISQDSAV